MQVAHDPLDKMKKTELAERAERVTAGTNWLPALVRVDGCAISDGKSEALAEAVALNWLGRLY